MDSDQLMKRALMMSNLASDALALRSLLAANEAEAQGFLGVAQSLRRIAELELAASAPMFSARGLPATETSIVHRN